MLLTHHTSTVHSDIGKTINALKGFFIKLFSSHYSFLEHGIHPPVHKPWEAPHVSDTQHVFRKNHGVYNVYLNDDDMKNNKPCNFEYPDVVTFTTDFYKMCNMIADGPL